MIILPPELTPRLVAFATGFTRPTYRRSLILRRAALLTTGRHTVADLLRTVGALAPGHASRYRCVLSQARWSLRQLACLLTRHRVDRRLPNGSIRLGGDDTVDGHPGPKVYGQARHRDPVRSSPSDTAWRDGHQGVVRAVLVRFPFATRPRALPVLVARSRSEDAGRGEGRPHRTPAPLRQ